jgi:hypothetical protein
MFGEYKDDEARLCPVWLSIYFSFVAWCCRGTGTVD